MKIYSKATKRLVHTHPLPPIDRRNNTKQKTRSHNKYYNFIFQIKIIHCCDTLRNQPDLVMQPTSNRTQPLLNYTCERTLPVTVSKHGNKRYKTDSREKKSREKQKGTDNCTSPMTRQQNNKQLYSLWKTK